jgi:hypothetical protein
MPMTGSTEFITIRVDFDKSVSLIEEMDRMSAALYERFLKSPEGLR